MHATKLIPSLLTAALLANAEEPSDPSTPGPFSTRMLSSIVLRQQGLVSSGQVTSTLESGLISLAIQSWLSLYASLSSTATTTTLVQDGLVGSFSAYADAILDTLATTEPFTNVTKTALLPLDRLTIAQAIQNLEHQVTADGNTGRELTEAEALALDTLNESLAIQERNQYKGFWYYVYPNWSYLDGAISFLPFMASQPTAFTPADALLQIQLLHTNAAHPSGLLAHGYDASKTAVWANNATGASPYVWGRSVGWYLAGLVNAWEALQQAPAPTTKPFPNVAADDARALRAAIQTQFTHLATALARYADPATGAWWQLPTLPGQPGNYLESSSTALFIFAMLKGLRLDILSLPVDSGSSSGGSTSSSNTTAATAALLKETALRAYAYATTTFVVDYGNGTLGYNRTVTVCSLNSTASYDYYVNQPINFNAPLGSASFVLASLEVERLGLGL